MRLIISIILILSCLLSSAKIIEVCGNCRYQNLSTAVEAASPHDVITIGAGKYEVYNLTIHKPLSIVGQEGVILDGKMIGYVIRILSDSVTIKGLKIIRSGKSYTKDYAAIYTHGIKYFEISNNVIEDPFFGILVEKSKHGKVEGNKVYGISKKEDDAGNGIHLWHCDDVKILNNEIHDMRDGVYLEFVNNSVVKNNHAHDNVRYGLHFMFSNHDKYLENTFENNGAGVAVMFSKYIEMRNNRFIKNWGTASYGLLLKEIYDAEVEDNVFIENTIGIFLEGSTRINYKNNLFERNGWAVKVSGGCYANHFFANNFIGNSFDISYNAKMNDNSFSGNYWSSYNGYDLDRNGTGDVPYRPVKLFSYIVNQTPETIVLMRSLFVDIINFSERVSPVFTPDELVDHSPAMKAH